MVSSFSKSTRLAAGQPSQKLSFRGPTTRGGADVVPGLDWESVRRVITSDKTSEVHMGKGSEFLVAIKLPYSQKILCREDGGEHLRRYVSS